MVSGISHVIQEEDITLYLTRMKELNIQVLEGRKRVSKEGSSVYFYDLINTDPFYIHQAAEYTVTEFKPWMHDVRFNCFMTEE